MQVMLHLVKRRGVLLMLVFPQSGSEPRFGPELFRTGPKSGSKFSIGAEPDPKSGSRFGASPEVVNRVRTEPDLNLRVGLHACGHALTLVLLPHVNVATSQMTLLKRCCHPSAPQAYLQMLPLKWHCPLKRLELAAPAALSNLM
jgi:hypothetical protein